MSRDSVRLAFTIAAFNGVDVMSCDLENVYVNAMYRENTWFEGRTECGEDKGKVLIVVRRCMVSNLWDCLDTQHLHR